MILIGEHFVSCARASFANYLTLDLELYSLCKLVGEPKVEGAIATFLEKNGRKPCFSVFCQARALHFSYSICVHTVDISVTKSNPRKPTSFASPKVV